MNYSEKNEYIRIGKKKYRVIHPKRKTRCYHRHKCKCGLSLERKGNKPYFMTHYFD